MAASADLESALNSIMTSVRGSLVQPPCPAECRCAHCLAVARQLRGIHLAEVQTLLGWLAPSTTSTRILIDIWVIARLLEVLQRLPGGQALPQSPAGGNEGPRGVDSFRPPSGLRGATPSDRVARLRHDGARDGTHHGLERLVALAKGLYTDVAHRGRHESMDSAPHLWTQMVRATLTGRPHLRCVAENAYDDVIHETPVMIAQMVGRLTRHVVWNATASDGSFHDAFSNLATATTEIPRSVLFPSSCVYTEPGKATAEALHPAPKSTGKGLRRWVEDSVVRTSWDTLRSNCRLAPWIEKISLVAQLHEAVATPGNLDLSCALPSLLTRTLPVRMLVHYPRGPAVSNLLSVAPHALDVAAEGCGADEAAVRRSRCLEVVFQDAEATNATLCVSAAAPALLTGQYIANLVGVRRLQQKRRMAQQTVPPVLLPEAPLRDPEDDLTVLLYTLARVSDLEAQYADVTPLEGLKRLRELFPGGLRAGTTRDAEVNDALVAATRGRRHGVTPLYALARVFLPSAAVEGDERKDPCAEDLTLERRVARAVTRRLEAALQERSVKDAAGGAWAPVAVEKTTLPRTSPRPVAQGTALQPLAQQRVVAAFHAAVTFLAQCDSVTIPGTPSDGSETCERGALYYTLMFARAVDYMSERASSADFNALSRATRFLGTCMVLFDEFRHKPSSRTSSSRRPPPPRSHVDDVVYTSLMERFAGVLPYASVFRLAYRDGNAAEDPLDTASCTASLRRRGGRCAAGACFCPGDGGAAADSEAALARLGVRWTTSSAAAVLQPHLLPTLYAGEAWQALLGCVSEGVQNSARIGATTNVLSLFGTPEIHVAAAFRGLADAVYAPVAGRRPAPTARKGRTEDPEVYVSARQHQALTLQTSLRKARSEAYEGTTSVLLASSVSDTEERAVTQTWECLPPECRMACVRRPLVPSSEAARRSPAADLFTYVVETPALCRGFDAPDPAAGPRVVPAPSNGTSVLESLQFAWLRVLATAWEFVGTNATRAAALDPAVVKLRRDVQRQRQTGKAAAGGQSPPPTFADYVGFLRNEPRYGRLDALLSTRRATTVVTQPYTKITVEARDPARSSPLSWAVAHEEEIPSLLSSSEAVAIFVEAQRRSLTDTAACDETPSPGVFATVVRGPQVEQTFAWQPFDSLLYRAPTDQHEPSHPLDDSHAALAALCETAGVAVASRSTAMLLHGLPPSGHQSGDGRPTAHALGVESSHRWAATGVHVWSVAHGLAAATARRAVTVATATTALIPLAGTNALRALAAYEWCVQHALHTRMTVDSVAERAGAVALRPTARGVVVFPDSGPLYDGRVLWPSALACEACLRRHVFPYDMSDALGATDVLGAVLMRVPCSCASHRVLLLAIPARGVALRVWESAVDSAVHYVERGVVCVDDAEPLAQTTSTAAGQTLAPLLAVVDTLLTHTDRGAGVAATLSLGLGPGAAMPLTAQSFLRLTGALYGPEPHLNQPTLGSQGIWSMVAAPPAYPLDIDQTSWVYDFCTRRTRAELGRIVRGISATATSYLLDHGRRRPPGGHDAVFGPMYTDLADDNNELAWAVELWHPFQHVWISANQLFGAYLLASDAARERVAPSAEPTPEGSNFLFPVPDLFVPDPAATSSASAAARWYVVNYDGTPWLAEPISGFSTPLRVVVHSHTTGRADVLVGRCDTDRTPSARQWTDLFADYADRADAQWSASSVARGVVATYALQALRDTDDEEALSPCQPCPGPPPTGAKKKRRRRHKKRAPGTPPAPVPSTRSAPWERLLIDPSLPWPTASRLETLQFVTTPQQKQRLGALFPGFGHLGAFGRGLNRATSAFAVLQQRRYRAARLQLGGDVVHWDMAQRQETRRLLVRNAVYLLKETCGVDRSTGEKGPLNWAARRYDARVSDVRLTGSAVRAWATLLATPSATAADTDDPSGASKDGGDTDKDRSDAPWDPAGQRNGTDVVPLHDFSCCPGEQPSDQASESGPSHPPDSPILSPHSSASIPSPKGDPISFGSTSFFSPPSVRFVSPGEPAVPPASAAARTLAWALDPHVSPSFSPLAATALPQPLTTVSETVPPTSQRETGPFACFPSSSFTRLVTTTVPLDQHITLWDTAFTQLQELVRVREFGTVAEELLRDEGAFLTSGLATGERRAQLVTWCGDARKVIRATRRSLRRRGGGKKTGRLFGSTRTTTDTQEDWRKLLVLANRLGTSDFSATWAQQQESPQERSSLSSSYLKLTSLSYSATSANGTPRARTTVSAVVRGVREMARSLQSLCEKQTPQDNTDTKPAIAGDNSSSTG